MPRRRGFIIAIETYPAMADGLAGTLPGTHQSALAFREWLIDQQGLALADIHFCVEDVNLAGRTAGATRAEIVQELARLKEEGKDRTDELYFLYVGHGLCYRDIDGVRVADIILASEYVKRSVSGNACLKIDEVQKWLRLCMGPTDHFYFIDACRNDASERDIKVGTLGLTYENSNLGIPTVYTLYSTVEGAVAVARSGFVEVLVDALKGAGRAKVWRGDTLAVLFRSVKDYVEKKLVGQAIDQRIEGGRDGLIREFTPPPNFECRIVIRNALPDDPFVLTVSDARRSVVQTLAFAGPAASFARVPDDYMLTVSADAATVEPLDPLPADLYEDRTVRFVKHASASAKGLSAAAPPDGAVDVSVFAPDRTRIVLRHLGRGDVTEGEGVFSRRLMPGSYTMKTVDAVRGVTIQRRPVEIPGGSPFVLNLRRQARGPLRDALLNQIPGAHRGGTIDLSQTLGPTPDQGLDLWLALIGASRIVGGPADFSRLGALPLASFADAAADLGQVYLLAGIEPQPDRLAVGISSGRDVVLQPIAPHPTLPGLFEFRAQTLPGYAILSLALGDKASISIGLCTLPNRATLLTISADDAGAIRIQQFMLPIRHLTGRLPYPTQRFFADTPLHGVRQMVEVQRRFSQSAELKAVLPREELDELLHLKWFEPVVALLAAYELARRGEQEHLREVVRNLRNFFTSMPDVEAIAKLAGLEWQMPACPPLVLDGLLSLNFPPELCPLDYDKLDYRGPWTTWHGALNVEQSATAAASRKAGPRPLEL